MHSQPIARRPSSTSSSVALPPVAFGAMRLFSGDDDDDCDDDKQRQKQQRLLVRTEATATSQASTDDEEEPKRKSRFVRGPDGEVDQTRRDDDAG